MKFVACKSRQQFIAAAGADWYRIVKVDGGYMGFANVSEYKTWQAQK